MGVDPSIVVAFKLQAATSAPSIQPDLTATVNSNYVSPHGIRSSPGLRLVAKRF